jgi:lipopolysaccharide export system permease protein
MAGITLIHRYLLRELVANAVVSLVATFAIFFLGALSLQTGKSSYESLPMVVVLKYVSLLLLYTAYVTIPLTVVTTCIFTYGRAAQEGEIAAAQTSGIRTSRLLVPAYVLGAASMLLLAVLQDRVMPDAHYRSRQVDEAVFLDVEQILKRTDRRVTNRSFVFTWGGVAQDGAGRLVLNDVELVNLGRDKKPQSWSRAKRATPVVEPGTSRITLELEDAYREQRGTAVWAGRVAVPIDLSALISAGSRNEKGLTYEELLSGAEADRSAKRRNRYAAEFHFRLAMALSPLLLGALAAPLGLTLRVRNRAVVFLAGVLVMAGGYLPLVAVADTLAERGTAPAWAILQVPNVLLLAGAAWLTMKADRP